MGLVSKEIVVLRLWEIKVYTVIPNDENLQALEHFSDQPNFFIGFIKHQFFSQSMAPNLNSTVATLTTVSALPLPPERNSLNL